MIEAPERMAWYESEDLRMIAELRKAVEDLPLSVVARPAMSTSCDNPDFEPSRLRFTAAFTEPAADESARSLRGLVLCG